MISCYLLLVHRHNTLVYVYEFLNLWTLFVELKEVGEILSGSSYPNLIHSEGEVPEEAPEKMFEAEGHEDLERDEDVADLDSDYNDDNFY